MTRREIVDARCFLRDLLNEQEQAKYKRMWQITVIAAAFVVGIALSWALSWFDVFLR